MTTKLREALRCSLALAVLPLFVGCGETGGDGQSDPTAQGPAMAPAPPGGPGMPGPGGPDSGIRAIMGKLTKGPNSLTPLLGKELKEESPPWETIQGQAKEYAQLAAEMSKLDPPKGSKESWAKLAGDFAESATDLDKAAAAKDKDAALTAHNELSTSCMACHREHRRMGPGMGGPPPGGFRGGPPGGGPGGPPPGGPGGPPPGGPGGPPPGGPPPQ